MVSSGLNDDNVEECTSFFISIINSDAPEDVPYFSNKSNVLVLYFDDVDEDSGVLKAFSAEQAKELIKFLDRNKGKVECLVHCAAGMSRSGAVGLFVNDYFRGDYFEFMRHNSDVKPNGHVLRTLNRIMRE